MSKFSVTDHLSKSLEDSISEKIKEESAILATGGLGDGPSASPEQGKANGAKTPTAPLGGNAQGKNGQEPNPPVDEPDYDAIQAAREQMSEAELFQFAVHDLRESEKLSYKAYSYWKSTFITFTHNKVGVFFLCLLVVLLLFTFIQPHLPHQYDYSEVFFRDNGTALSNQSPSRTHWFGTNNAGQDLWSRTWAGTRNSLFIGFMVALFEAVVGILIGLLWGYVRKLDFFFTELWNIFDNVPQTIVLVLLSYIMSRSMGTLIFAMSITGWLAMALFIRNQVLMIRDRDYNLASRCLGTPIHRIILKNLLPYIVSVIMLRMALTIPSAISNEVFITYIGLGLPASTPSLGSLVNAGRALMMSPSMRYQLLFPTLVLSLITISFYVIGNAFSDSADPRNHR